MGSNRLTYLDDPGSPTANLLETKVLLNITISDVKRGARLMTIDIQNYFLAKLMAKQEFTKVHYKHIQEDIRVQYKLHNKLTSQDYIYMCINK